MNPWNTAGAVGVSVYIHRYDNYTGHTIYTHTHAYTIYTSYIHRVYIHTHTYSLHIHIIYTYSTNPEWGQPNYS